MLMTEHNKSSNKIQGNYKILNKKECLGGVHGYLISSGSVLFLKLGDAVPDAYMLYTFSYL